MKYCKGCHTFIHGFTNCSIALMNESDRCPCKLCLIKVVCSIACPEFEIFVDLYELGYDLG